MSIVAVSGVEDNKDIYQGRISEVRTGIYEGGIICTLFRLSAVFFPSISSTYLVQDIWSGIKRVFEQLDYFVKM
uniref:Uncharacterized protein n=1 Tax=Rhizophora mucronata TaxID=61149 RepID=A0A2P2QW13_RHIMU